MRTVSLLFAKDANGKAVIIVPLRILDDYKIKVFARLENFPSGDDKEDVSQINHIIEKMTMIAPEQYLWMNKRFKTRHLMTGDSLHD